MAPNSRGGAGGQNLGNIKYNSYQDYSICLYLDNHVSESVHAYNTTVPKGPCMGVGVGPEVKI